MFFSKALQMDDTLGGMFDGVVSGINAAVSGSSGGSGINWNNVINQGFALASQGFNAFGGQNTGTQFAQGSGGIFALASAKPSFDDRYSYVPTNNQNLNTNSRNGILEDAGGGIMDFISRNPLPVFGGIAALYLLMKEPPRRR